MERRLDIRAPLGVTVKYFDWNRPQEAEGTEISVQGVFLKTAEPMAEDRMLTLRVTLPGGSRPFTVLGKVVRTVKGSRFRPGGMDVRFVDLAAPDREVVSTYVSRRMMKAA